MGAFQRLYKIGQQQAYAEGDDDWDPEEEQTVTFADPNLEDEGLGAGRSTELYAAGDVNMQLECPRDASEEQGAAGPRRPAAAGSPRRRPPAPPGGRGLAKSAPTQSCRGTRLGKL